MSKKHKSLLLWDIVPGAWYLPASPIVASVDCMLKVQCDTTTTGWQRGHVVMSVPRYDKAHVWYTSITGHCGWLNVRRMPQDYRYGFTDGNYRSLWEIPNVWIEEKFVQSEATMGWNQQQHKKLKELIDANALR